MILNGNNRRVEKHNMFKAFIYKVFLEHPQGTDNPQSYYIHGLFSVFNSTLGLWYMLIGIIHGIIPYVFPFSTSSYLIRSFKKLVLSRRHTEELQEILDKEFFKELNKQKKVLK
jgi:hypothetical protein